MSLARNASKSSDHHSHSLGCAVFTRRGRVLSVGCNKLTRTHPLIKRFHAHRTIHAEMDAILSVRHKHDLNGTYLLVYRENKSGMLAMARPCDTCIAIIKLFGISRIFYTTEQGLKQEKL